MARYPGQTEQARLVAGNLESQYAALFVMEPSPFNNAEGAVAHHTPAERPR